MKRKEFLDFFKRNKGKNIEIEMRSSTKNSKKTIIEKMEYEVRNDIIFIKNEINSELVEINLNTIREVEEVSSSIIVHVDNREESQIKISAI